MLYARTGDTNRINFLKRIFANRARRHLTTDDHHRDRIEVGGGDAGHRVGQAGSGGDQADADLLARSRVPVRSMGCALLMTHQDVLDLVLLENFVVKVEHGAARIAKQELDLLLLQAFDDDFSAGKFQCRSAVHDMASCGLIMCLDLHANVLVYDAAKTQQGKS